MDRQVTADQIKLAEQELEAATTSVNAARRKHEQEGSAGTAAFLRDAEVGYQQALTQYNNAMAASTATPASAPAQGRRHRARTYGS